MFDPQAGQVWYELFEPLEPFFEDVQHWVVVPFTDLAGLPIEVLIEVLIDGEDRRLVDRFTVYYVPSGMVYAWLRERSVPKSLANVLVVADPPFSEAHAKAMQAEDSGEADRPLRGDRTAGRLQRLPHSRDEALSIAESFPEASLLLGERASEAALLELVRGGRLAEFDVLHFATHARVDPLHPERSEIYLSQVGLADTTVPALLGEHILDGRLRLAEVVREWELDAGLVTLSACETGLGEPVSGEGWVGFAHGFLQAGSRSVLVSLWPVDDAATARLMQSFYSLLAESEGSRTRADALAEAKRRLRGWTDEAGETPYAHPAFWAAFVLIGTP